MEILKGKPVADRLNEETIAMVNNLKERGINPCVAIIRVGAADGDLAYERGAVKKAELLGIKCVKYEFDEENGEGELKEAIRKINSDEQIHGVLLLRPLPKSFDEASICDMLSPDKDIDAITSSSAAFVYTGSGKGFAPCTAEAVIEILKYYDYELSGKNAVVIGRSLVIGKPVSMLLMKENATVTVCHSKTGDALPGLAKNADIIVSATGKIGTVSAECMSEKSVIIDVGINFDEDGKMCGDVDYEAALEIASAATPVPGGVGAVTTSVLMRHVALAAMNR